MSILTKKNIGEKVSLNGWVNKARRLGDLVFIDLRNQDGITQIIIDKTSSAYEAALLLRSEYVITIEGTVSKRKEANPKLPSGEIEILATKIIIINKAKQTPLIIADITDALEPKRMEYRYLDLRRPVIHNILLMRAKFNHLIRNFFYEHDFVEVETPMITKPTPGGANELNVLSMNHVGKYYVLAQSPQIYKQLLMYGGIEKYYQIVKCFRDEDSRADRQLEFTQLDLEKSFTSEKEIKNIINQLLTKIVKEFNPQKAKLSFEEMSYIDALNIYGSDKPDTRFANHLVDLTKVFAKTELKFIQAGLKNNQVIKGLFLEQTFSNAEYKKLEAKIKLEGGSGLATLEVEKGKIVKGSLKGISEKELSAILELTPWSSFTLLVVMDSWINACELLGRIRFELGQQFELANTNKNNFVWITEWPLFALNKDHKLEAMHNPFTAVADKDLDLYKNANINDQKTLLSLMSQAYDIVLNGSEIGGGAIRFSDFKLQGKVFEILGLSNKETEEMFGWLLEAQQYGIPQHGGIALGLDRILAILLDANSIRDVIAFPKATSGKDEMMKAPINKEEGD